MEYKCLCCNKYYQNTVTFSNKDINKLILLLRKSVYVMNIWIIVRNLMKTNYLKNKIFTVT